MPLLSPAKKLISRASGISISVVALTGLIHPMAAVALPAEYQAVDGLTLNTQWQLQSTLFSLGDHRLERRLHPDGQGGSLAIAYTSADLAYQPHSAPLLADTSADHGLFQLSVRPTPNVVLALHAGQVDIDDEGTNSLPNSPLNLFETDILGLGADWFVQGLKLSLQTTQLDTRIRSASVGAARADTRLTSLSGDFVFDEGNWHYGPIARLSYATGDIAPTNPAEPAAKLNSLRYQAGFQLARDVAVTAASGGQLYIQTLWTREFKDSPDASLPRRDRYAYQYSIGTQWWTQPGVSARLEYRGTESVGDSDLSAVYGDLAWHF